MPRVRIIGRGRAGTSLARALQLIDWDIVGLLGRDDDASSAADGVDALVIATPDGLIGPTASSVTPCPDTVVLHLSGSLGLDVLGMHPRRASLHPLVPLPDAEVGAQRLLDGATFAVNGDPLAGRMAAALGGRIVEVDDARRVAYHAAACIAANHVVALLGQVERVAASVGLGLDTFLGLTRAAVDDVARLGPRAALTGPASRSTGPPCASTWTRSPQRSDRHTGRESRWQCAWSSRPGRVQHVPVLERPRPAACRGARRPTRSARSSELMRRRMMKSKIHRATVTGANLHYVGSVSIDVALMELADILPNEQVAVLDLDNGARFETYAIAGGPGEVCLNGAAARLVSPGDHVILLTYADYSEVELANYSPRIVYVDASQPLLDKRRCGA